MNLIKMTYFTPSPLAPILLAVAGCLSVILGWTFVRAEEEIHDRIPVFGYEIVNTFPHDSTAFTQGLCFNDGMLYEGTGLYGQSSLSRATLSGREKTSRALPDHLFGEGITVVDNRVLQLTLKAGAGLIWGKKNLRPVGTFFYPTQGWGLTHNDQWLIMSDGSDMIYFLDQVTFKLHHHLPVMAGNQPLRQLNELEWIKGEIWANIWKQNRLARIDPVSGRVIGWLDLSGLAAMAAPNHPDSVLNGIAYDSVNDRIFVTGKRWPQLFEIRVK